MGIITAAGSIGRVILPLGAGLCYSESGEQLAWGFCFLFCWLSFILYYFFVYNTKPIMLIYTCFTNKSQRKTEKKKESESILNGDYDEKNQQHNGYMSTAEND